MEAIYYQKELITLKKESNLSVNSITAVSARPPELLIINPRDYFWLFERLILKKRSAEKLRTMLNLI